MRRKASAGRTMPANARVLSRAGELIVGKFIVRTLAFKGANGIGHAEAGLMGYQVLDGDATGLQEVRRDGQSSFVAARYEVCCGGADGEYYIGRPMTETVRQ